jgi:short-subunit dehydrogenase
MGKIIAKTHGLVAITGASSGIGAAIAKTVARLARRIEKLERLAEEIRSGGGLAYPVPIDLASP